MINKTESKYTVLIFEDDFTLALEWEEALGENGIHTEHAWDVDEAISLCNQKKFDVIICDVFIKDKDGKHKDEAGLTLLVRLRRQLKNAPSWGRDVPILVVTGSPINFGFDVLDNIKTMGTSLTMRKPFRPKELVKKIQEIISEKESKRNKYG